MANAEKGLRFFDLHDVVEACEWAAQGGIAAHRNFDVDGVKIGIRERSGAAFHVMGERDALTAWAVSMGLRAHWIQRPSLPGIYPTVWHFDVFGALARRLLRMADAQGEQLELSRG